MKSLLFESFKRFQKMVDSSANNLNVISTSFLEQFVIAVGSSVSSKSVDMVDCIGVEHLM